MHPPLSIPEIPGAYRHWIKETFMSLQVEPLSSALAPVTLSLPDVYIPIEVGHRQDSPGMDIHHLAASQPCLLLSGEAGMGKTTLIKHLALRVIERSCAPALRDYLPVIVSLKHFWPVFVRENPNRQVEQQLNIYFRETGCPLDIERINPFLSRGKVLFLFDGLDEIPRSFHGDVVDMLGLFQTENSQNRFLFTGRPQAIAGRAMKWFGDYLHTIEYIAPPMIEHFINKWFDAVSRQSPLFSHSCRDDLLAGIMGNIPVLVLSQIPSLLTAACILYQYVNCLSGQDMALTDYINEKLARQGLISAAQFSNPNNPNNPKALLDYLFFIYAQTNNKNRKTFVNPDLHDLLKKFLVD